MQAYHIDRSNTLTSGQIINLTPSPNPSFLENCLFPNGVSYHGFHYLDESVQNMGGNKPAYYVMEFELELIRRCFFPKLPSRFQSFFALKSLDELGKWAGILNASSTIWLIEFDESQSVSLDSNLLIPTLEKHETEDVFSPQNSFFYYYCYWNNCYSPNPRLELLIKPPIKVLHPISGSII